MLAFESEHFLFGFAARPGDKFDFFSKIIFCRIDMYFEKV